MEFAVSAPLCFVAGVIAVFVLAALTPIATGGGSPLARAWTIAVLLALAGLVFYISRVVGLQLAGSLDVVRVAFGYSLWLVFCGGMGVGTYVVAVRHG